MKAVTTYEAEDGSRWGNEESCRRHEILMRGDHAPRPEIGYLVANVDGDWRAYKRVNRSIERLGDLSRNGEADDAFMLIMEDIGYPTPVWSIDGMDWFERHQHEYFPRIEDFKPPRS